ncbi:MAG: DUF58 domain-containing protein [Pseudomonadota bacterium]
MLASEIVQRVREIQVRTGRHVADVLAGEYVSVFRGAGIEFEEVRPYLPGDDVRTIDWNVTARAGAPHVKRYVEERQLTLMLMADVSASQDYGSGARSKREAAAELCALLAFSATYNDDKVGLVLFDSAVRKYVPPRKGTRHALRVIREVLATDVPAAAPRETATGQHSWWRRWLRRRRAIPSNARGTDIDSALRFFASVNKRRTVCFVVSDFLDTDYERTLSMVNRRHDVVAVLLTDPAELAVPATGLVNLRDAETGSTTLVDTTSAAFRNHIAATAAARVANLKERLGRRGIDLIHIDAAGSIVDPVVRFFRMRERRNRR